MRRSLLPPRVRDRHESWFVVLPLPAGRDMLEFRLRGLIRRPLEVSIYFVAVSYGRGCLLFLLVVATLMLQSGVAGASTAVAGPVPSLTPVQTAALWRQEVSRRGVGARGPADEASCRLAQGGVLRPNRLVTGRDEARRNAFAVRPVLRLRATARRRTKTQPRSKQAASIRALGANFHALDEISWTGWSGWVAAGERRVVVRRGG